MPKIYVYGSRDKLENYANALEGSGLEGLFSLDISQAEECDGLLLPGGGDLSPMLYGQPVTASSLRAARRRTSSGTRQSWSLSPGFWPGASPCWGFAGACSCSMWPWAAT